MCSVRLDPGCAVRSQPLESPCQPEPRWDSPQTPEYSPPLPCFDCHSNLTKWRWSIERRTRLVARPARRGRRPRPVQLLGVGSTARHQQRRPRRDDTEWLDAPLVLRAAPLESEAQRLAEADAHLGSERHARELASERRRRLSATDQQQFLSPGLGTPMGRRFRMGFVVLRQPAALQAVACAFGLTLGIALHLHGSDHVAHPLWAVTAATLLVPLTWSVAKTLLRGDVGVDSIALIAIASALVLGEYLAAAVVALMLAGGNRARGVRAWTGEPRADPAARAGAANRAPAPQRRSRGDQCRRHSTRRRAARPRRRARPGRCGRHHR